MVTMASSAPGGIATTPRSPDVTTTTVPKRTSENRRSNKPIMEKRRRARINNSLNELKSLILDAMKKDPARHSKLEKADILEMAVRHLEMLHKQQATTPNLADKYRAGFTECASEVNRFPGLEPSVRKRLVQHLNNCLNSGSPSTLYSELSSRMAMQPNLQVQILPSHHDASPMGGSPNGIFLSANGANTSVQLVPTRLPNGEYALILPSAASAGAQQRHHQSRFSYSPALSSSSLSPPPLTMFSNSPDSGTSSTSPVGFERLRMEALTSHSSLEDMCHSPASGYSSPRSPVHDHTQEDDDNPKPLDLVVHEGAGDSVVHEGASDLVVREGAGGLVVREGDGGFVVREGDGGEQQCWNPCWRPW